MSPTALPRGAAIDLPAAESWTVTACWNRHALCEVDLVAFVLSENGRVSRDEDFVFYGATQTPDGTVRLAKRGPTEQTIAIDLTALPETARTITVAAAIDGPVTFGDLGPVHLSTGPSHAAPPHAQAVLNTGTTERTMLIADVYRRGPRWRLRVGGQGYDFGLAALARGFGVDVDD